MKSLNLRPLIKCDGCGKVVAADINTCLNCDILIEREEVDYTEYNELYEMKGLD